MQADHLAGLSRHLDMTPAVIFGGQVARVSLLTAANHPDVASGGGDGVDLGGVYGLRPEWQEVLERNPRNREIFEPGSAHVHRDARALDAGVRSRPGLAGSPGSRTRARAAVRAPVLVFRSGVSDPHHSRATSERVRELIPGSRLLEPPWGDNEWNGRGPATRAGRRRAVPAVAVARAAAARVRGVAGHPELNHAGRGARRRRCPRRWSGRGRDGWRCGHRGPAPVGLADPVHQAVVELPRGPTRFALEQQETAGEALVRDLGVVVRALAQFHGRIVGWLRGFLEPRRRGSGRLASRNVRSAASPCGRGACERVHTGPRPRRGTDS